MCPECQRLLANPTNAGLHLVNPVTQKRAVSDPHGRRICPDLDCLSLWEHERVAGGKWMLIETKGGLRKPRRRASPRTAK